MNLDKIMTSLIDFIESTGRYFNGLPRWVVILLPLFGLYLTTNLTANEEQYMQLAKQYMNTRWIVNSQNLTEVAGTRIFYQLVVGKLLQFFSFELLLLLFRLVLILSYTLVLSKIYKKLLINNQQIIFHLYLFIVLFNQCFFAGSFIFLSVEPKCFSFFFILLSFYFLLKDKFLVSLLSIILATYIHVLDGVYVFCYVLLTLTLLRNQYGLTYQRLFKGFLLFVISVAPLLIYLIKNSLDFGAQAANPSPSWIYTYYRTPHHTALAKNLHYFFGEHFIGIFHAFLALFFSFVIYFAFKPSNGIRLINKFVIVSLIGTLILIPLSFVDSEGLILKFYLYRINTLSAFFFTLIFSITINRFIKTKYYAFITSVLILMSIFSLLNPIFKNQYITYFISEKKQNLINVCDYIKLNTPYQALIFCLFEDPSFTRRTERNIFSIYKFIPAQVNKINGWYERDLEQKAVISAPDKIKSLIVKYGIDYIVTLKNQSIPHELNLIYENDEYLLYKVNMTD